MRMNENVISRDQAIGEADEALKLTREERIKNFEEILKSILNEVEDKGKENPLILLFNDHRSIF